jgi:two-component system NtrC family sensor kinase
MKISLRTKLNISFLTVIIICGLVASLVGMRLIVTGIINQAQDNVKNDLNSAREIYQGETERIKDVVRFTALRFLVRSEILANDIKTLREELDEIRKVESLDILTLTDKNGHVIVRSRNASAFGDNQRYDQLISQILSGNKLFAGTVILKEEELIKEGNDLVQQAYTEVVSTPKSIQKLDAVQTSAMCMKAASAVFDHEGRLIGVLYGGNLINRNSRLVDKVKKTTYQDIKYRGADIGVSTIFQGDTRIATNVLDGNGNRAIGTRMSKEVYEQVVAKGTPWVNRAFVVDKWYITAYEPIKDTLGQVVGVLSVGMQVQKFVDMRNRAVLIFLGMIFGGMIIAVVVSNMLAKGVLRPIKELIFASGQWAKGNLDYRVKTTKRDEVSELGQTFNLMASSLKDRDEKLKEYTDEQIMKSERLATLGQLSAGVAHEINNPLGAILMYSHLALEDLGQKDVLRKNLEKTIAEASRCKYIVKGLFDFAHQTEPKVQDADINGILARTLAVTRDQALFRNITITRNLCSSLPWILVDVGQIQQVFTNIVLNAAHAMRGEGELTVVTKVTPDEKNIEIEFRDTGCGIEQENLEKIFEPFFTTKEVGKGTGLGLAVSYGIIKRHNGTIEVRSKLGSGTSFIIRLPITDTGKED